VPDSRTDCVEGQALRRAQAYDGDRHSVFYHCAIEAQRHKWIESEKAERDLGESAVRDWHTRFWRRWCRARWIEHLQGKVFWLELDRGDFGILNWRFKDKQLLLDRIIDRILNGAENLDILMWAATWGLAVPDVVEILEALDMNSSQVQDRGA